MNVGLEKNKTYNLNKFFKSIKKTTIYKVKLAVSSDEKLWYNYKSKWINNKYCRNYGHKLRSTSQAILTTSKTVIDNPKLTIRLNRNKEKHIPIIIIDKHLKIPKNSKILRIYQKKIIIFTSIRNKKSLNLTKLDVKLFIVN